MSNSQLYVDSRKLVANLDAVSNFTQRPLLFVVKANAYGHGLEGAVVAGIEAGVEFLGVVNVEEARAVRAAGYKGKILILGVIFDCDIPMAIELDTDIAIWRPEQIQKAQNIAFDLDRIIHVHLKIDTGMGRLGVLPSQLEPSLEAFSTSPNVHMRGVYSHFSEADAETLQPATDQLGRFEKCLLEIREFGLSPEYRHIANSPASMRLPPSFYDLVRVGITAYGLKPTDSLNLLPHMAPIATWKTRLAEVRTLPKGHGISYGSEYVCKKDTRIGIIPVGYADGFRRYPSGVNTVLVSGTEVPVLGRVCMDHAVLNLDDIDAPQIGDEVTIIGSDGCNELSAEELARRWGTNNYDVIANIGSRVERIFL